MNRRERQEQLAEALFPSLRPVPEPEQDDDAPAGDVDAGKGEAPPPQDEMNRLLRGELPRGRALG